ncbi:GNAT family N-acetyltransferase [Bacillus sp. C1-1]|nr:GNAT family N-acetyltransferase [Bacillus sp. C1-1]
MIRVRPYTLADFDGLLQVQKEAFPPPYPGEQLWSKDDISAHVDTFPEGALLAEYNNTIVGSATSLLTNAADHSHSWSDISDNGTIRQTHDPNGKTLYGIDLCVHPTYRNLGIAKALYDARKETVRTLQLHRYAAGSRLPGYHHYTQTLSIEEYVESVQAGKRTDPVLSFMLKQGLTVVRIEKDYLPDVESNNYGVLVEWRP